jgi:hypothetical protein
MASTQPLIRLAETLALQYAEGNVNHGTNEYNYSTGFLCLEIADRPGDKVEFSAFFYELSGLEVRINVPPLLAPKRHFVTAMDSYVRKVFDAAETGPRRLAKLLSGLL